jgi:hypothetical protein
MAVVDSRGGKIAAARRTTETDTHLAARRGLQHKLTFILLLLTAKLGALAALLVRMAIFSSITRTD